MRPIRLTVSALAMDDAVRVRALRQTDASLKVVAGDKRLRWPDTFAERPDGSIHFTTSRIQVSAFFDPKAPAALPTTPRSLRR